MATALRRPVPHDARLSLTEHLDELRSRLIICALALVACFAVTFWQSDRVLEIVNEPLRATQNLDGRERSADPLEQNARFQVRTGEAFRAQAAAARDQRLLNERLASEARTEGERAAYGQAAIAWAQAERTARAAADATPTNRERQPVTLGVAEPFTTTISVSFYAAVLLALPVLLFQAYAFLLPAFEPRERRVALPLMLMVPVLFISGVTFGYFVVLPRAVDFLQNFNDDDFDILIQARDYFRFAIVFMGGIGLLFQLPVGVLAVTRLGVVTPQQLWRNQGYVILGIAALAAVATPTPDPITMTLAMGPLIVLFWLSVGLAAWINRIRPPGTWWDEGEDPEDAEDAEDDEYPEDDLLDEDPD